MRRGTASNAGLKRCKASTGAITLIQRIGLGSSGCGLTYVTTGTILTHMVKTQVYLREEELAALHVAAARSGRSVAELVRDAVRKVVLLPQADGPVAIWDGEPKRTSMEHDSVHDEP